MLRLSAVRPSALAAAAIGLLAQSVDVHAERLPIRVYTTADGLAQNQILRIVRDSRGLLWFCTKEGLSRFDGQVFTNYTTADGLPHRSIRDILEGDDGVYWVATGAGLVRWTPTIAPPRAGASTFNVYFPAESDHAKSVRRLLKDPLGTIWVGTEAGLYRLELSAGDVRFREVDLGLPDSAPDSRLVEDLAAGRDGALWIATRASGLLRRSPDGHVVRYAMQNGLPANRINVVYVDRDDRVWAGTPLGLARLVAALGEGGSIVERVYDKRSGLIGVWIDALLETRDGTLWVGQAGGLSAIDPHAPHARVPSFTQTEGVIGYEVESLVDDEAGNLWIATSSSGALKLVRDGFTLYGPDDGLGGGVAGGIFASPTDGVCVYGDMRVARFDGRRFIGVKPRFGRPAHQFGNARGQVALRDREGDLWLATGAGLFRFPKVAHIDDLIGRRPRALYDAQHNLGGNLVLLLYEDRSGDVWILSDSVWHPTLTRWERRTASFHQFTESEGWPRDTYAIEFAEHPSGDLWIAAGKLVRYRGGRFRVFTEADGLPVDSVTAAFVDHTGRLWLATDTAGVLAVDGPTTDRWHPRAYTTSTGLASNQTFNVTEDTAGRIYVVTGRGVDRLDPATGDIRHYTPGDGLSFGPFAFRDPQGALWFGSSRELSRLLPVVDTNHTPPSVWISGVTVSGVPRPMPSLGATAVPHLALHPDDRHVSIEFFGVGERQRYQYRLERGSTGWSPPTEQRIVHYAALSPGTYRFAVRAINLDGLASVSAATVAFTIPPPLWLRWWAIALMATGGGLLLLTAHRRRVARLVEVERMRTRIATDLHDDLGANLSRIAIISEVIKQRLDASDDQAHSLISEIADSSRGLLGSLRDLLWAIDPSGGTLADVESRVRQVAAALTEPSGIAWRLTGSDAAERVPLDAEQRRHLLLFFKEGLCNAVKHAGCRSIEVSVNATRETVVGTIADNGRGFDATSVLGTGRGLGNMQARAAALRGRLDIVSAAGVGTTLTLSVPRRRRRA